MGSVYRRRWLGLGCNVWGKRWSDSGIPWPNIFSALMFSGGLVIIFPKSCNPDEKDDQDQPPGGDWSHAPTWADHSAMRADTGISAYL